MTTWQTMETAPAETPVLVFDGWRIMVATNFIPDNGDEHGVGWMFNGNTPVNPTHWMPLPAPPAE